MDLSQTWPAFTAVTGGVGLVGGWVYRIWDKGRETERERVTERNKFNNDLQVVKVECAHEVDALRNTMYADFVQKDGMERFEKAMDEVKESISRLDAKFDRKFDNFRAENREPR